MVENSVTTSLRITPKTKRKILNNERKSSNNNKEHFDYFKQYEFISTHLDDLDNIIKNNNNKNEDQNNYIDEKQNKDQSADYIFDVEENNNLIQHHREQSVKSSAILNPFLSSQVTKTEIKTNNFNNTVHNNTVHENRNILTSKTNIITHENYDINSNKQKDLLKQIDENVKSVKTVFQVKEWESNDLNSVERNSNIFVDQEDMGKATNSMTFIHNKTLVDQHVLPVHKVNKPVIIASSNSFRSRNKSTGDVDSRQTLQSKSSPLLTPSIENLYENGKFSELLTSEESLDERSISPNSGKQNKPKKPKRSFDRRPLVPKHSKLSEISSSLDNITELTTDAMIRSFNAELDYNNQMFISKEDFDKFIETEKNNFSGVVTDESSFLSDLDQSINDLTDLQYKCESPKQNGSSRYLSEKSKLLDRTMSFEQEITSTSYESSFNSASNFNNNNIDGREIQMTDNSFISNETLDALDKYVHNYDKDLLSSSYCHDSTTTLTDKHDETQRIEELGNVLDSQIEQLETLLTTSFVPPPSKVKSKSINPDEPILLENIYDHDTLQTSCGHGDNELVNTLSYPYDKHVNNPIGKHLEPCRRTMLPDIPEAASNGGQHLFGMKKIRQSLRAARIKVAKIPGHKVTVPIVRKSFRLPKSMKIKNYSLSRNIKERRNRSHIDSPNVVAMRYHTKNNEAPARFRNDNRSSKMLGLEYETAKKKLDKERTEIEEERNRLTELKRQAAEKAELEWMEKKREHERREIEEREIDAKKEYLEQLKRDQELKAEAELQNIQVETEKMRRHEELLKQREEELAELHKERERREELEKLLKNEKHNELLLAKTLTEEKQKLNTLERSLSEEKHKRHEIEKKLQDEEMRNRLNDEKTKNADSRSNGAPSMNGTLKRRQPSYNFSLRSGQSSGNSEDLNLMHHIAAAGHVIENCSAVKINRYSCRGYLLKMGKTRLSMSTWKRRWFVFDRKLRAFCYYQDERKTKSKGILYFQSIQEVYVDASVKRSPNPKTTFCVRTPQRTYMLAASSPIAMSIWIDVIFTGKEGTFLSMTL